MKKQTDSNNETKNSIITAFCILYLKKPIDKISIRELTDLAGYNRTTFYHHFSDIYDVLKYMENSAISYTKEKIIADIKGDNPAEQFINTFIEIYEKWDSYIKVLLSNQNSIEFKERLKNEIFYECLKVFNLPKNNHKAYYTLDFYLSALLSIINTWVKNQEDMSSNEMREFLKDMLTNNVFVKIHEYANKETN